MDREKQKQPRNEVQDEAKARDLKQEREEFMEMISHQSEASREYTKGKLLSA
ncbi:MULTISPECIES: hypothetical protein [Halocynthiibacter]|uniref:Uncharacterized protein n=1 Tax=Halocynthiibacter halioticoli TaxID=2986804 RepID=A0AAE3J0V3_9RHOB|nr:MULTISPECIES: hypothetical protein [Halocynthiibacter]MCV6823157.1 hypothetical protein [Halocynthiibacter halioticoli]MCW4056158.1 hypothetical protein [Halocynthiibacter sp. SDUM655004]